MDKEKTLRLSPSTGLNLFRDCPRCFWLHYNEKVRRPRGIFPSLPGGMDLVIKDYFDQYRGSLPPEIDGKVKGKLIEDVKLMNRWRNWRTGLEYTDKKLNATLFGALDECIEYEGKYIPVDYKTRGSAPREGDSERYYQTQLDTYALLLEANGYKAEGTAYLIYYYPQKVGKNGVVTFSVETKELTASPDRVKKIFEDAVKLLRGPAPKDHSNCEYCSWGRNLSEFD
ncbi:MAG TPA: hypothetical protein ENH35_04020 [Candidatus Moranbacteria bacterium]|nr:hypothetical protein [Candidatus Moranbacteria bacterium]